MLPRPESRTDLSERCVDAGWAVVNAGCMHPTTLGSPDDLAKRLGDTGYLCDESLATIGFLALSMQRPLLLEGEPGTGKTALAEAFADALDLPLIRLQCYEGIDAGQALYDWDFPRQILHLRALEAAGGGAVTDADAAEESLFDERLLLARPVLRALRESPAVLLVDEIDRADDEFEAFLLEVLSTYQVTIPELGTVSAATPPVVVLTSNRTREVHDALKRRCLYQWIDYPSFEKELAIVRERVPQASAELAERVTAMAQELRAEHLYKVPGVSETIDWAAALVALDRETLDADAIDDTLGVVLKAKEDLEALRGRRARELFDRALVRSAARA